MDHLTRTPPEILLQIISHLPIASLPALAQSSRTLSHFLRLHAPTIYNTRILAHHALSCAILQPIYIDGWLVPTHPCIFDMERRLAGLEHSPDERVKILRAVKAVEMVYGLEVIHEEDEDFEKDEGTGLLCCTQWGPHPPPPAPQMGRLKLSEPGPQYFMFLERYGWEIEARAIVFSNADQGGGSSFEFMVGNYCVKKFLEMCEETLGEDALGLMASIGLKKRECLVRRWKDRASDVVRAGAAGLKDLKTRMKPKEKKQVKRVLMFGEIEIDGQEHKRQQASLHVHQHQETENWVKGLLWYYGSSSRLPAEPNNLPHKFTNMRTTRKCLNSVRNQTSKMRTSLRRTWRALRCHGHFEALD